MSATRSRPARPALAAARLAALAFRKERLGGLGGGLQLLLSDLSWRSDLLPALERNASIDSLIPTRL